MTNASLLLLNFCLWGSVPDFFSCAATPASVLIHVTQDPSSSVLIHVTQLLSSYMSPRFCPHTCNPGSVLTHVTPSSVLVHVTRVALFRNPVKLSFPQRQFLLAHHLKYPESQPYSPTSSQSELEIPNHLTRNFSRV